LACSEKALQRWQRKQRQKSEKIIAKLCGANCACYRQWHDGRAGSLGPQSTFNAAAAKSWLIRDSLGVHCRFGLLAHAESILQPLLDNHRKLTLCFPLIVNPPPVVGVEQLSS
jgi:hypothetical protein